METGIKCQGEEGGEERNGNARVPVGVQCTDGMRNNDILNCKLKINSDTVEWNGMNCPMGGGKEPQILFPHRNDCAVFQVNI